jgi:hypothetical protein
MENITVNSFALAIIIVAGFPVYIYVIARWVSMAVIRSYFEIKKEFNI